MTESYRINAWAIKEELTTGQLKKMRKDGFIPGIIYGGNNKEQENMKISVLTRAVDDYMKKNLVRDRVVSLDYIDQSVPQKIKFNEGELIKIGEERCFIRNVEYHPVSDLPIHIELQRLPKDPNKKIKIVVPIREKNYFTSPGIKKGGKIKKMCRRLKVYCPCDRIIQTIEVDLEKYEIGDIVRVKDLSLPDYVQVLADEKMMIMALEGKSSATAAKTE